MSKKNTNISDKNLPFYEQIPISYFQQAAKKIGLDSCCDIKEVNDLIQQSDAILDIGAGWGRVINYLISSGYQGEIFAVERSAQFYNYLKKYENLVSILKGDIRSVEIKRQFPLIIWMWGGIAEMNKPEQLKSVQYIISSTLANNGYLVIDTAEYINRPPKEVTISAIDTEDRDAIFDVEIENKHMQYHCYMMSSSQMSEFADVLSLKSFFQKKYITDTGVARVLHIFQK
ncbi:MAG: class I SAM-dependent methyltransferase [Gammaproteobacteria bacterium]|nr:MAG: class I SAM-dependent methyltransferase [Gammaproteobacteria bacterium]UTW42667.1 hypothetical protein KFE69_00540 [bacterium SCSIO 12844]